MKQRILYIDILKLFTIYLVIWGHAIMHFQPDYEASTIFQIIHSFHMPLFMMLSGYFSTSSMELTPKAFIPKKFRQLLLPCISWGILCWLVITSGLIEGHFHLELKGLFTGWLGILENFWFLKSCFICYTLTWICWRFGRYKLIAMAVVWVLCTLQGRFLLNTMFPSFILGIYLRKSTYLESWITRHWYAPVVLFLPLLFCKLWYINTEPYPFKLILGLSGALSCFVLFKIIFAKLTPTPFLESLARLGGETLGVYVIQAIFLEVLMPRYISFESLPITTIAVLMPLLSLIVLVLCLLLVHAINKSKWLASIMFGRTNAIKS